MKNWTIGKRITFGFSAVILVMLALGIFTHVRLNVVQSEMTEVARISLPCLESLAAAQAAAIETRALVYKHVFSPTEADMSELESRIKANSETITKAFDTYEKLGGAEDKSLFAQVKTASANYVNKSTELLKLSRAATNAEASAKLIVQVRAELDPLAEAYSAAMTKCQGMETKLANESSETALAAVSSTKAGTIIGLVIAVIVGAGLAWAIIQGSKRALQSVANMLNDGSAQIASAASQVSLATQSTAEGASEQAASLEETSASLEQIASMTKRNAENAGNCKSLSGQACASANTGLKSLAELGRTLETIKSAVAEMQTAVRETQSSSQEISKIIKTIDEIAFQTNLLALNAAVEAARAGEAGAGFAVVADEVRSLAQRSAQAARDTANKIESAVKRSELGGAANLKVVQSLTEVDRSAQSIQQVFSGIVTQIQSLDQIVAEIAAASNEQSQGISEVNMAVSQMDKVTQSNAANAEENAASSQELNAQAASLQDMVAQLELIAVGHIRPMVTPEPPQAGKARTIRATKKSPIKRTTLPADRDNASEAFGASLASGNSQSPQSEAKAGSFQNF